jgi:hypothetical protein
MMDEPISHKIMLVVLMTIFAPLWIPGLLVTSP